MVSQSISKNKGSLYNISYMDNSGKVSERRIKVLSAYTSSYGKKYIRAWCYLRNEERTFRADRIISISSAEEFAKTIQGGPLKKAETADQLNSFSKADSIKSIYKNTAEVYQHNQPYQSNQPSKGSGIISYIFSFFLTLLILSRFGINFIEIPSYESSKPCSTSYFPSAYSDNSSNNKREKTVSSSEIIIKMDRISKFRVITGINNLNLENIYQSADLNRDNTLGQKELEVFQKKLYRKYKYISNETALRPDQFLNEGGGDCEDWALFTCGLLRYWGIACAVGSLSIDDYSPGHAVALVYKGNIIPAKGVYYNFNGDETVLSGIYIPVDYNQVGDFSTAVNDGWSLRRIYIPEEIYGDYM